MVNHHISDNVHVDRQTFIGRRQTRDLVSRTEQLHREVNLMYQGQQHAAAEILAGEVRIAIVLVRVPVCDPLPNLTLEHERLSGSLLRQKLLQFPHCGMKLQIVSYKRNDSTLPDLLEKLRDAFERCSQRLLDKNPPYVRPAAPHGSPGPAPGVAGYAP